MALPLCGRRARGKVWRGPRSGRLLPPLSSLSTGGFRLDRIGFHDSFGSWPRRSSGNGGKPSQPQPEPDRAGRLRAAGRIEAKGRAADEAAARRKLRACPLADARAACFVKRPSVTGRPSGRHGTDRPDTGSSDPGSARRKTGLRSSKPPNGEESASAPDLPAGSGFGPALRNGEPRISVHGRQAEPRLRPRIPPSPEPKLRPRDRDGGKRDASSEPPDGEPPGLRPWSGSPRGNRLRLRPEKDPGGTGAGNPRFQAPLLETARRGTPRLPGQVPARDSGGRRQRRPPLLFVPLEILPGTGEGDRPAKPDGGGGPGVSRVFRLRRFVRAETQRARRVRASPANSA